MLLVVDIGNTKITCGIFDGEKLVNTTDIDVAGFLTHKDCSGKFIELRDSFPIDSCAVSSVVDEVTEDIKKLLDKVFELNSLVISSSIELPVILDVAHPETVGADRIANVSAVAGKYNTSVIIVDAGTATTFDIINSDNEFWGGIIMPGLRLQAESLGSKTSKLPTVEIKHPQKIIGTNTEEAILSGIVAGHALGIDGLIRECQKTSPAKVILTGGYSKLIAEYLTAEYELRPNLTLEGIRVLYDLNRKS